MGWGRIGDSKGRTWDLKVFQYVCSGVRGEGPGASFIGCKGRTGADILLTSLIEEGHRVDLFRVVELGCGFGTEFLELVG